MVSGLFLKHSESTSNARRSSAARRHQANTVSAKFQSSLQELLEKMERFESNLLPQWEKVHCVRYCLPMISA